MSFLEWYVRFNGLSSATSRCAEPQVRYYYVPPVVVSMASHRPHLVAPLFGRSLQWLTFGVSMASHRPHLVPPRTPIGHESWIRWFQWPLIGHISLRRG